MKFLIDQLQPSQLFINQEKLSTIRQQIETEGLDSLPLVPIRRLDEHIILTDGHTRTFAVLQSGQSKVAVEWDEDEMDWTLYRLCVHWAQNLDITHISDLSDRILPDPIYQQTWIATCHRAVKELDHLFPGRSNNEQKQFEQYPSLSFDNLAR